MSEIGIEYKKIMEEIENAISNEKEKQFVKTKMAELSISFVDIIDRITKATDMKIKEMEKAQSAIEHKISNIETIVDNIEGDIYEDDEDVKKNELKDDIFIDDNIDRIQDSDDDDEETEEEDEIDDDLAKAFDDFDDEYNAGLVLVDENQEEENDDEEDD